MMMQNSVFQTISCDSELYSSGDDQIRITVIEADNEANSAEHRKRERERLRLRSRSFIYLFCFVLFDIAAVERFYWFL